MGTPHKEKVRYEERKKECLNHANIYLLSDDEEDACSPDEQQRAGREPAPDPHTRAREGEKGAGRKEERKGMERSDE